MAENVDFAASKLRKLLAQLPYLPQALALVWRAARVWTLSWAILLLVQGLLPVAIVYLSRSLINSLVPAIRSGGEWQSAGPALALIAVMAGLLLLGEALRGATNWMRAAQSELVQDHIRSLIHQKSLAVDLAFYESPDYYDHLYRARAEASYRPVALLESLGSLLQNTITLAAMGAVLSQYGAWLPVALLVSTLPAFFVVVRYAERQHDWRMRTTTDERRAWYYDWLLTAAETAAELRLFASGNHFQSAYQALRRRLHHERLQLAKDQSLSEFGAGVVALLVTGGALAWMVWKAARGLATLGDLALFYQAFNQGLRLTRSLLDNVGQLYANILFLGNLFEFLALQPQVVDLPRPAPAPTQLNRGLYFHRVTFRYPGSRRVALQDFNLVIPAGQISAVIGSNGAGKSTLIKLLCRFYDPEAGHIELDGIDIRRLPVQQLRRLVTVLFQEPVHYNATAASNIALGDLAASPGAPEIREAADAAGAHETIAHLPKQYDNLLGKWFVDGTELSVGEWQRIALARALVRQAPIVVLDEPTSAMDPWAEVAWLERFRSVAAGRTTIIITHRLTTAMHADAIHVMADGRILESGRHQELLVRGGRYAQAWAEQMRR